MMFVVRLRLPISVLLLVIHPWCVELDNARDVGYWRCHLVTAFVRTGPFRMCPSARLIANSSRRYPHHQLVDNRVNQQEKEDCQDRSHQGAPRHKSSAVLHTLRIDPKLMCILVLRLSFSFCPRSLLVGFLADASSLHPSLLAWSMQRGDSADAHGRGEVALRISLRWGKAKTKELCTGKRPASLAISD